MMRIITYARNKLLFISATHLVRLSLYEEILTHVSSDETVNDSRNKIKHFIPQIEYAEFKKLLMI